MSRIWRAIRSNPYGWFMLFLAALAMVATLPGRTHGLGMITERLLTDPAFQLDRVSYADMNLWATLLGGLFCLPCGYLIDRYGLKVALAVTVLGLGLVIVAMTRISGWWTLFGALVLTRGFGQSALSIISIAMVGKWFAGRQSLPMAIYTVILSLGFAFSAQLAKPYANADWRVLWGGMGWILLGVMLPLGLLFVRNPQPRTEGTDAEGNSRSKIPFGLLGLTAKSDPNATGFTLLQAMRTQAFWVFGIAISVIALVGSGASLFNESVLKQQGFPTVVYYNLITLTGMVGLLFQIPVGWLGLHMALNRLHAIGLFLLGGCLLSLPFIHSMTGIRIYAVGMGLSGTITTVLFFTIWAQAYGRAHLGLIQSVAQMLTVLASALGPKVFAECFARHQSYAPVFQVLAGLILILAVWSLLIRVPSPEEAPRLAQEPVPLAVYSESPA